MPRPTQEITAQKLPPGYENLRPLPERQFPISPQQKTKLDWECDTCGFIDCLSYDNMKAKKKTEKPLAHGMGCKSCRSARAAMAVFLQHGSAPWLTISGWRFDHSNDLSTDSRRRFESIVFEGHCERGHRQTIPTLRLKSAHKHSLSCPACIEDQQRLEDDSLADPIRAYWQNADIRYYGRDPRGTPHFHAVIPGTDATLAVDTRGRLRGSFDTEAEDSTISITKLNAMVRRDTNDRKMLSEFIDIGHEFGSVVVAIGEFKRKKELRVYYRNVLGETRGPYSLLRAREFNAGRPIKKQTQALVQCVVMEAFPDNLWRSDDRSYLGKLMQHHGHVEALSVRSELDIGTLGVVDGGLWLEYQGQQTHAEGGSAVNADEAKLEVCAGRCLLLVIPPIQHGNACQAIHEVKQALENHPDRERAELALAHWAEPDPERVIKRWLAAKPEMAKDTAKRLKASMGQYGHRILTRDLEIYSGGTFSYQCGYCGEPSHNNNVKSHIDSSPKGCSCCEKQRMAEHVVRKRYARWSDHPMWRCLSDEMKGMLCDSSLTYTCPLCESEGFKSTLANRDDYFCLCCLDTGRLITSNGQRAGTIYQSLPTIRDLIHEYDEAPEQQFEEQISIEDRSVVVTMTVNGRAHKLSLTQWKREAKRPYSKIFHQTEEQHPVLKTAFPNYELVESDDPEMVFYRTGLATVAPGGLLIPHPTTKFPRRELSTVHNKAGGKQRRSKNEERGERGVDWEQARSKLSHLYDLKNESLSSSQKTLGEIEARYRFRAAVIGTDHIPPDNIRDVRIIHEHSSTTDYVKTSGQENKCTFYCADNRHPPERKTTDARLSNIFDNSTGRRKPGFCTKCIKAAGKEGVDFRRLEREAEIVNLKNFE